MSLSPKELRRLGKQWETATGRKGWQEHLAAELPVHITTVRRWRLGRRKMMPAVEPRVREILGQKPAPEKGPDATSRTGSPGPVSI